MKPANIQHLVSQIHSFPPLPAVVNKILQLTNDPESSVEDLMEVIRMDPAMASAILKIANSVFYGIIGGVSTLQHALTVLGFAEIQNIILSKAIFNSFKEFRKSSEIKVFWKHSFNCGIAAKHLITQAGFKKENNEFFVAGLIHDIGKLIIHLIYSDQHPEMNFISGERLMDSEKSEVAHLDLSHSQVGQVLLNSWIFPQTLVNAVGFHHNPLKAGEDFRFPMITFLADFLSHGLDVQEYSNSEISRNYFSPEISSKATEVGLNWNKQSCETYYLGYTEQLKKESELYEMLIS